MCLTCHYSIILPSICRPISQVRLCSVLTPRYNYYNGGVSELGKNSPCLGQDVINDVLPWDCTSCICYQYWRGPAQTGSDWRPPPGVSACRGAPLSRTARTAGNQNLQQTNVITLTLYWHQTVIRLSSDYCSTWVGQQVDLVEDIDMNARGRVYGLEVLCPIKAAHVGTWTL